MVVDLTDFGTEGMSKYFPYDNESKNVGIFPILDEEPEVTPELGEQYLNAKKNFTEREQDGHRPCGMSES